MELFGKILIKSDAPHTGPWAGGRRSMGSYTGANNVAGRAFMAGLKPFAGDRRDPSPRKENG